MENISRQNIIKQIEKKNYLKNLIDFFNKKTTYFLNSNDVNSEIDIVLCFRNSSYTVTVTQENIRSRNETKIVNKSGINNSINILDDFFKHNKNSECYAKFIELKNCLEKNIFTQNCDVDCEKYEYIKLWKDQDFESDNIEGIKNVIIDPLGLYISDGIYDENDKTLYKCKVLLFCDKIINVAANKGLIAGALFEKVLVHELAHAFHHIGLDSKGKINPNFHKFDRYIQEGFANYMVYEFINYSLITKFNKTDLEEAFKKGTSGGGPYGKYLDWINKKYSILAITTANNHFRYLDLKTSAKIYCNDFETEIDRIKAYSNI